MSFQRLLSILVMATLLLGSSASQAVGEKVVTGIVVDPQGIPVATASVTAVPIENGGTIGALQWSQTDSGGHFRITLRPGRYVVRAKAEANGYADPSFLLSANPRAEFPESSVGEEDISGVRVTLGTKGGILQGTLLNAATQAPIPKCKVVIYDARKPEVFVEVFPDKTGRFSFTVPNKPIVVGATAPGYHAIPFRGGEEITLSGGEYRTLTLELKPK